MKLAIILLAVLLAYLAAVRFSFRMLGNPDELAEPWFA